MPDCKFKVGDRVAVLDWKGHFDRISRVRRVMVRFVELDSGSKWQLDGSRYPKRQLGDRACILETTPEHEDADERRQSASRLFNMEWRNLSVDQLRRVMAIVNEGKVADGQ